MRIVTLNVNGLRAAARKGFFDWLPGTGADVVCLQEIKAGLEHLAGPPFQPAGWHVAYLPATRPGYSGVGLLSRRPPDALVRGFGSAEFDAEGRYLEARFGSLSIVSLYLPSGSSSPERQAAKFRFMNEFTPHLARLGQDGRRYLFCGDCNIAHKEIDLKNWRSNQKNSGFLPEERAWLDQLFGGSGFVDSFREVNTAGDQYTWWSNRGQAYSKNVGWRIDYQIGTPNLRGRARSASIYKDQRFSDHAPLVMDYALDGGAG